MTTRSAQTEDKTLPELGVSTDAVSRIVMRAREFDVKEGDSDPNEGSNAIDDGMTDVLEDKPTDAARQELAAFINGMDEEERANLVALAWIGRGTYDIGQWDEALMTARSEHARDATRYLLGLPLLGDFLADGLAAFGESWKNPRAAI